LFFIVHWYGPTELNNNAYALVNLSQIAMLESELRSKYPETLLPSVECKKDKGLKLNKTDMKLVESYVKMHLDLYVTCSEQSRGVLTYKEHYESLSWSDIAELDDNEDEYDEIAEDHPANIRPNETTLECFANDAEESKHQDKKNKKQMQLIKEEDSDFSDEEKINVPEAKEDAVNK